MSIKVRWWDACLVLWTSAKVTTCFMESLHLLNITFALLPREKSTDPGEFNFSYVSPLKSLNLVLIPGAKLDGHRSTWTGSLNIANITLKLITEILNMTAGKKAYFQICSKHLSNVFFIKCSVLWTNFCQYASVVFTKAAIKNIAY